MASQEESTSLERGTVVSIDGLQSDAGKKLNGGLGIVLNELNAAQEGEEAPRYPVRIFATKKNVDGSLTVLVTVLDKRLKPLNLTPLPDPHTNELFLGAVYKHIEIAGEEDVKKLLFWLEIHYKVNPKNVGMAVSYANALRKVGEDKKGASDLMVEILEQVGDITQDEQFFLYCKEAVISFCNARDHLDLALKYALLIPTPDHKVEAVESWTELVHTCKHIITSHRALGVDDICQINLQAGQKLWELEPTNPIYMEYLGGAFCLAGDNLQGAKYYRQALAAGGAVQTNLIIAQLQCPGMPLEDYHLLNMEGSMLTCVHNKDKGNLRVDTTTGDVVNKGTTNLDMIQYEIPSSVDDPEVFGDLLEQLNETE